MVSGCVDMVTDVPIAEFSPGVEFLGECSEILNARVEGGDLTGVHGEDFGPVGASIIGGELCFNLRKQVHHCVGFELPGEVDGEGWALIRHAHPQVVGSNGAEFGDVEVRGDAVAEGFDSADRLITTIKWHQKFGL